MDWTSFRSVDGLCRKAGAPREELAGLVIRELVDNALDAAGDCELSLSAGVVVVEDRGGGIPGDDEQIARLFSMNRPMTSSKYWRLPTRGALGNGLRVAIGAVAATGGKLLVGTRGRTLEIIPDPLTGGSRAIRVGGFDGPGTRIELVLGRPLEPTPDDLLPSDIAIGAARSQEKKYGGKSSPHWYDADALHELLRSAPPEMTAREVITQFDGCSGSKAGKIADGFAGRPARGLGRDEARELLDRARDAANPVNPERLGAIGKAAFPGAYAKEVCYGEFPRGPDGLSLSLPVVIEAWADLCRGAAADAVVMVNGTPAVGGVDARYSAKEKATIVRGAGLRLDLKTGKQGVLIHINIIIPYMPVTNDGKLPALGMFGGLIGPVAAKAVNRAKKARPADDQKASIKAVVFEHMEEQIGIVSDGRRYRFGWRQVFYRLRPIVEKAIGDQLQWKWFQDLVTEYEAEHGEEKFAYRDPRGTLYIPHSGESIPLGTLQVEQFRRPQWRFNKILFLEKEGFFEALKADGWPGRHDCALMTSKGQPTRAARDLIDLLAGTDEPVQVFCLHDADAAGTIIYQTLQEETLARPRRSVEIVDLGVNPWEAVALAEEGRVEIEDVSYETRQTAAAYVGEEWAEWLQAHRVELNAFTTAGFIDWLDGKMARHAGKLIPPRPVLVEKLDELTRGRLRDAITDRVLAEAGIDARVEAEFRGLRRRRNAAVNGLRGRVAEGLAADPCRHWADAIAEVAEDVTASGP
jgi:hypothetical protein